MEAPDKTGVGDAVGGVATLRLDGVIATGGGADPEGVRRSSGHSLNHSPTAGKKPRFRCCCVDDGLPSQDGRCERCYGRREVAP